MTPPPAGTHSLDPAVAVASDSALLGNDLRAGLRGLWKQVWTPALICFAACGAVASTVFLGSFALMVAMDMHYMVAGAISAVLAVTTSFTMNRRFTFGSPTSAAEGRLPQYIAVQVVAASCYLLLLHIFVSDVGIEPIILAQCLSASIISPMNFVASQRWGFR